MRGRTTTRSGHNPQDGIIRGKEACRAGQDCRGRIKRKESPAPGLERPRESGGQRRMKQEAEAKVEQRRSHDKRQSKGQRHGEAVMQR